MPRVRSKRRRHRRPYQKFISLVRLPAILASLLLATILIEPVVEKAIGSASSRALHGHSRLTRVREYLSDPLLYFMQRSPGARDGANLLQTKQRVSGARRKGIAPREQVLAEVRYGKPNSDYGDDLGGGAGPGPLIPDLPDPSITPPLRTDNPVIPHLPFLIQAKPLPPTPTPTPTPTPPPISAAPEPAAWLMMIGGFLLIGARLRSKRRFLLSGEN